MSLNNSDQTIQGLTASSNLSEEDIENMRKEAESHAEEDNKRKEKIDIFNQADTIIYTTEKTMKDMEGKVDEGKLKSLKDTIAELKKFKDSLNYYRICSYSNYWGMWVCAFFDISYLFRGNYSIHYWHLNIH